MNRYKKVIKNKRNTGMFGKSTFKIMDLMDKEELKNVGTPKKNKKRSSERF